MAGMRVIGLAGWSGAGKTTLIVRLIPELRRRGYSVSTLKHAHHDFDVDQPGKDSFEHRAAGAREVLIASANRLALMRELRGAPEPPLADLLRMLAPVDLVLIEGFKRNALAKIEVWREAEGKPPIHPQDPHVVALVSDSAAPSSRLPHAPIDDVAAAADLVLAHAEPVETVLERLALVTMSPFALAAAQNREDSSSATGRL
jgi:molybdopterin-guanine dinucleotide biosynthesis protein B